jgi:Tfp pilus assembly protein PilF
MALSESVETSLKEAEQSLRNALAYAARQEKPFVGKHIADMIMEIDNLIAADQLIDKLEQRMNGDDDSKRGRWGPFSS